MPDDARGVLEVIRETWLTTYPNPDLGITRGDIKYSFKDSLEPSEIDKMSARIASTLPTECRLVAECGGDIVGIATMVRHHDHNELRAMYVLEGYQGQGVGHSLWQIAKDFADPHLGIIVRVATYTSAVDFYKKLGFIDTGNRYDGEVMRNGTTMPEMELVYG